MADGVTAEQLKAALAEVQLAMADQIQKNVQLATSALEDKFKAGWAEQQAQAGGATQAATQAAQEAVAQAEATTLTRDQILLNRIEALEGALQGAGAGQGNLPALLASLGDMDDDEDDVEVSPTDDAAVFHSHLWSGWFHHNPVMFAVFRGKVRDVLKPVVQNSAWYEVETHLSLLDSMFRAPVAPSVDVCRLVADRWLFLHTSARKSVPEAIKVKDILSGSMFPSRMRRAIAAAGVGNLPARQAKALQGMSGGKRTGSTAAAAAGGRNRPPARQ